MTTLRQRQLQQEWQCSVMLWQQRGGAAAAKSTPVLNRTLWALPLNFLSYTHSYITFELFTIEINYTCSCSSWISRLTLLNFSGLLQECKMFSTGSVSVLLLPLTACVSQTSGIYKTYTCMSEIFGDCHRQQNLYSPQVFVGKLIKDYSYSFGFAKNSLILQLQHQVGFPEHGWLM